MSQNVLSNRSSVCPGASLSLQPLPRIRLLKVSVFISASEHFTSNIQHREATHKKVSSAETKIKKLLIPWFVPDYICIAKYFLTMKFYCLGSGGYCSAASLCRCNCKQNRWVCACKLRLQVQKLVGAGKWG